MTAWIFLVHLAAALLLTGLIWFVQLVHYPLFAEVGQASYVAYQRMHMERTGWIVGPLMVTEIATAVWLAFQPPPGLPSGALALNLGLNLLIWVSTAALQVPAHRRLLDGFQSQAHARLVATNWLRTGLWSFRAVLLIALAAGVLRM